MKTVLRASSLSVVLLCLSMSGVRAMSCSERHQECLRFCERNYKGRPGCTSQCGEAVPKCMQSGCWVSKMANKCGYTKG